MTGTIDAIDRSRSRTTDERPDPVVWLVTVLSSMDRYDLTLAVIPAAFGVALAIAAVAGLSAEQLLVAAAAIAVAVVADACYLNPPIDPDRGSA